MNKTKSLFAAAILLPLLNCPLRAETALEQFEALGPVAELALPQPAAQNAQKAGLSPEEARKKLPLFDYLKSDVLSVKRNTPVVHHKYSVETIELLVQDPLRQLGEFKQEYIYYRSDRPGPRPTVLISPPFIPQPIDNWSARHFVKKGYNAIIMVPGESITDTTRALDQVDDMFIRGVIIARMCVDLAETFPEVDKEKIYAYGISLGAIKTSLIFGVEPRVKKAVEIVGGGDIPGIITDTHFKLLVGLRDARMQIEGIPTLPDLRAYLKKVMTVDPLDFASLRKPEDIFLILGHNDQLVPDIYQKKLYSAFSRPLESRFPLVRRSILGHYTTAVKYGIYIDRFVKFAED